MTKTEFLQSRVDTLESDFYRLGSGYQAIKAGFEDYFKTVDNSVFWKDLELVHAYLAGQGFASDYEYFCQGVDV